MTLPYGYIPLSCLFKEYSFMAHTTGADVAVSPKFGQRFPSLEEYLLRQLLRQSFVMADGPQVQLHIPEIGPVNLLKLGHALTSFPH